MAVAELVASARPEGNRVDLSWTNPDEATLPGMRIVRRAGAYPTTPIPGLASDGVVIADSDPVVGAPAPIIRRGDVYGVADTGLRAEAVYYYRLFPYAGSPPSYELDPVQRISAMATGPYRFAALMRELLPGIYHRYDTVIPARVLDPAIVAAMSPEDRERGQLSRFLELIGGLFDQQYSAVRSLRDLHDPQRLDGRLLPLLAEWIGWRPDFHIGHDRQRREIRDAPAIYHAVENVATVEATVRRISGWETRSKEFVDNVAASNRPERLNLWLATDQGAGFEVARLSLDHAFAGRPAVASVAGADRLVYHTRKNGRWEIWQKVRTGGAGSDWQGSEPVVRRAETTETDPVVAVQGATAWLFWSAFDAATGRWRIDFRREAAAGWTAIETFRDGAADVADRRAPAAVVDGDGALWLFWLELVGDGWVLRHHRFTTDPWAPTPAGAVDVPDGPDMRVEADVFVVARPPQPTDPPGPFRSVGLLWARHDPVPGDPGQSRWRVTARFKNGLDPADVGDWTGLFQLPPGDPLDHDREPAAVVDGEGSLQVVWSATRDGSWSVWRSRLDAATGGWSPALPVTGAPFSDRSPVVLDLDGGTAIAFRSNRSVEYHSEVYRGTETVDRRYSGATTVLTGNGAKSALRTRFDDFGTYTYDTGPAGGRTDDDWYGRDTLGLYLEPDTLDQAAQSAARARLRRVLPEFVPLTDRTVFVSGGPTVHIDHFYGYGAVGGDIPPAVGESATEQVVAVVGDTLVDDGDFSDLLEP